MSRSCLWDRYWGRAGPYKQSQKPLRKLTRPSLFLFSKVANSVTFFSLLIVAKNISFKYKIKEHLPRLL